MIRLIINVRKVGVNMVVLTYNFSAIRGKQSGKDFYSFMCPLNIVSRLFSEDDDSIPEIILNKRIINNNLVENLTDKILNQQGAYFVEPILAAIDEPINFKVLDNKYAEIGVISFSMLSTCLIINGIEEKIAIERAIAKDAKLRNSVLSVIVFFDPEFNLATKLLNNMVVNNIIVDKIELYSDQLLEKNDFIKKRMDMNNKTLGKYSKKLFLKKHIAQTTKVLLGEKSIDEMKEIVDSFWINYFTQVELIKQLDGYKLRTEYVIGYSTVLEGIALAIKRIYNNNEYDVKIFFEVINCMDWSRNNEKWKKNMLTNSGRVIKNSEAITYVTNIICEKYKKTLSEKH